MGVVGGLASVFTRIIAREIPAKIFLENDDLIVIADHRPRDTIHLLIIPKAEYTNFQQTPEDVLTMLLRASKKVASDLGLEDHYRLLINNGYGQEVDHVHIHFLSNRASDKLLYID